MSKVELALGLLPVLTAKDEQLVKKLWQKL
jgi:hypothetical protein